MDKERWMNRLCGENDEVFSASARVLGERLYVMAEKDGVRSLLIAGRPDSAFHGVAEGEILRCPLDHENLLALQKHFPYTAPVSLRGRDRSIGLGDRLGVSSAAHLRALEGTDVFPVIAQQSKRELDLTGRSNRQMMDDVAWQVFEAGYEGGYAADGDHRKTLEEVQAALEDGVTMMTLDCSEHIDNDAWKRTPADAKAACAAAFAREQIDEWTEGYCGKAFRLESGVEVTYPEETFFQMLLTYGEAIAFATRVYHTAIAPCSHDVSFEVSIDETETTTEPCAHYFVAAELQKRGVRVDSMAPRFCGEFQKGVDYIGDLEQFRKEFRVHAAICQHFGYRISVHSGSDKFSVFPDVGRLSGGRFHLKTSGTTWVEGVRVLAMCTPALFRRMVPFSCAHFAEAKAYYHVSASADNVPDLSTVADAELPALLDQVDVRQVMHITYGFLLQAADAAGKPVFRDEIYLTLHDHRAEYEAVITHHIRRHLVALGVAEP